ncbi:alpha/beta hydrolase [Massilia sp. DJPM01]|uniref:esterase/lipase family protein n=1 Tax=Massilia sp. DJPM01 TaxID=3024404 RepID=UPI00259EA4B5|nr:alpha/beta hydrolase [Massilia sp. DJPM01]MDM5175773.1 alpha/beta hydrolase [Massilia sp. DJPM01]
MMKILAATTAIATLGLMTGCATPAADEPALLTIDGSRLPPANVSMRIPGLSQCTDSGDHTLKLNAQQPVTVLVHGCFSSAGRYRGMAQVLAFHGQQTACFTYNDRDSLRVSAGQLDAALGQLARNMENKQITVLGHSQGALIARNAMSVSKPDAIEGKDLQLRLVTVSGPFGGIAAARHCGSPLWKTLSLGLVGPICQIVTGDKWSEITYTSPFIREPGPLDPRVKDFLKIMTDESGSCRRVSNGTCVESDAIFSLAEQRNPAVDSDPLVSIVEVKAGHVEIVGNNRTGPVKLIAVLQEHGVIKPTQPDRMEKFGQLLTRLFGEAAR